MRMINGGDQVQASHEPVSETRAVPSANHQSKAAVRTNGQRPSRAPAPQALYANTAPKGSSEKDFFSNISNG